MSERRTDGTSRGVSEPIRVLHVVKGLSVGGLETYLVRAVRYAHARPGAPRFLMDVCYEVEPPGVYARVLRDLGSRVFRLAGKTRFADYTARMAWILRRGGYRAVCDFHDDLAAPTLLAARAAGVPRRVAFYRSSGVFHRQDPLRMAYRRVSRAIVARAATSVLANSRAALDTFYPGVEPGQGKWHIVPNGIDTDEFSPPSQAARAAARARWGVGDRLVIGHIGVFKPMKNHLLMLRVFARLRVRHPDTCLLLVSDGPLRSAIEAEIRALDLDDHVILTGRVRPVVDALAAMDLFWLPSLREGMSNAMLEAQSMALPVLASDAPGVAEHIPAHARDWIAPVADEDRWLDRLDALVRDPAARAEQGASNRAHVIAHYQHAARIEQFLAHLTP